MAKILVIEDEEDLRFIIVQTLADAGHSVEQAPSVTLARQLCAEHDFELILTDLLLGSEDGMDLVKELREKGFDGVIVAMTAHSSIERAVAVMREGADDYLQKPLSLDELDLQVPAWLERRRRDRRLALYERLEKTREHGQDVLGDSPAWREAIAFADRYATVPVPDAAEKQASLPCILLLGETGVGKGVLARYIHSRAIAMTDAEPANAPPFVHVNCAALPANLVEGELFGHEKGAFTDARESKPGLFELAEGGTIFLDEIGEMPLELQAKLLLVVEHGTFRRVGGTKERTVRARVIAASNQQLDQQAEDGTFRRDLLYRLNTFTIEIPPLREREGDGVLIAQAMLARIARQFGRNGARFSDEALEAIRTRRWPGNVRELINCLQRAVVLSDDGVIGCRELGFGESGGNGGGAAVGAASNPDELTFDFDNGVFDADGVEKALIVQALRHTKGNISQAAKLIGMQRSSLRYRIERAGLEPFLKEVVEQ